MKKLTQILLCAALFCVSSAAKAATAWDVYICIGQSNMDGRGKNADLDKAQRSPMENARIFYRNPPASSIMWMPLAPGYSIAPGYKGGLPSQTFGPEIGFAAAMLKARPGDHLAIIKGSKGGSSLSKDWNPGVKGQPDSQGPCYRNFLETMTLAKNVHPKDDTLILRGVLWHQGESDASLPAGASEERLTKFIARLREDLNAPSLPFVIGEVFDNGKRDLVRAEQRAVAEKVPHCAFVSAENLKTHDAGTHFDAASQMTLGARFADAMVKLLGTR